MRAFTCPDCSSLVPFESTRCLVSDSELGYWLLPLPTIDPIIVARSGAYGTPTRYEITLYRVTVTQFGHDNGWTVELLCDEALGYGGLTLGECPRAALNAPPKPFRF